MARYPGAIWRPLPENATEPRIRPTQVIVHTMWGTLWGTDGWFRRSDVLSETHFGIDFGGAILQWMDTERQADGNYLANDRAISIETEDNRKIVPWSDPQLDSLAELITWCAQSHDIPALLAPDWNRPGMGWHVMFPDHWTTVRGKTCPGGPRINQFINEVLPEVQRRLGGGQMAFRPKYVVYGKRGTPDFHSACAAHDSNPAGGIVTADLSVAKAALKEGITVYAAGGPAAEELRGEKEVRGKTGALTLKQLADIAAKNWD